MARPIDANELETFPYSEGAGTEEQIADWIEQVGLSEDDTASRARDLCWKVIEGFINVVKTQPTLTPPNEPLTLDSRLTPKLVTCPKGWKGVRYTRFHCPGYKKVLKKGEAYCHKCGQALIFPAARYDKENNRIWLDFSDRRPPEGEA